MSALQPLRSLRFEPPPFPARNIGARGKLEWIKLSELSIDAAYQREILDSGKSNIKRMIEGFSWALFGVLVVGAREGGHYTVIDGQHRATAAKMHGAIVSVPCVVLAGGVEEEARAFAAINGNVTRIHALQSFRASVAANMLDSVALVALCRRADVTIAPYPKMELAPGETMALGAVKKAIAKHGDAMVLRALKLLRHASPDDGLGAAAISGAVVLFAKEPELAADPEKRGDYLRDRGGLTQIMVRAEKRRVTYGGTMIMNFAAVLRVMLLDAQRGAPMARMMAGK